MVDDNVANDHLRTGLIQQLCIYQKFFFFYSVLFLISLTHLSCKQYTKDKKEKTQQQSNALRLKFISINLKFSEIQWELLRESGLLKNAYQMIEQKKEEWIDLTSTNQKTAMFSK